MSLCWEVWGAEEGVRVWALMKLPPPQLLAILAAVGTAVFLGAPSNRTVGALPGGQFTRSSRGLRLGRER